MNESLSFLKPYLRGWPILLGAMVVGFMLASKYLNYVTPMFESTAKLRLADLNEGVPNSNLFKDLDVFASTQKINTEIELLKSHSLISKALTKVSFEVQIFRSGSVMNTELFKDSPILISPLDWPETMKDRSFQLMVEKNQHYTLLSDKGETYSGKLGDTILVEKALVVISLNHELLKLKEKLKVEDHYLFSVLTQAKQISIVSAHLDIIAVDKDVPVIRISFKSSHPAKAALLPNALAEAYIEDYIQNKYSAANVTVDFLNDRIEQTGKKLEQTERNILTYRDNQNITNIRQETETDLRKIAQLKIQQTNLRMNVEAIRELERYIQSGKDNFLDLAPNFEAFTDLLSTEIIKNIKQLQAERKDLLLRYTEQDEKVKVIDAKIKDLTSYLIESITNTRKNLEVKYDKLTADIDAAEQTFIGVPEKERMMTILTRDFELVQQSYNFLNQKKIEAEIAKAAKLAFHRVITPATLSKVPVSPNRTIIKIVSSILGLIGAVILIFIVHMLKARVNDVGSIERTSMIPLTAAIPKLKGEEEKEQYFIKMVNEWEVKGVLKANQITCFTGFDVRHGVRFAAEAFGHTIATQGRKVLLIDLAAQGLEAESNVIKPLDSSLPLYGMTVPSHQFKTMTVQKWSELLNDKAANFDQTIVLNAVFGGAFTLATMAAAQLNIVSLDARLSPAKLIPEVDLMQQEYQLPNVHFVLNRAGYTPSFIKECLEYVKKLMGLFSRKNYVNHAA